MIAPVEITINGLPFGTVVELDLVADLYTMGTTFDIVVVAQDAVRTRHALPVQPGDIVGLQIDGSPYLKGVVLESTSEVSSGNRNLRVSGCDFAGLLDISQMEKTVSPAKMSVMEFAKLVTGGLNKLVTFTYAPGAKEKDQGYIERAEIGATLSAEIGKVAHGRGLMAWSDCFGQVVFGTLQTAGKPEYRINADKSGAGGVRRSSLIKSIRASSKKIIIATESDKDGAPVFNVKSFDVPGYPAGLDTVRAGRRNSGDGTVRAMAEAMAVEMTRDMGRMEYDLIGLSNGGKPWMINKLCTVVDDWHGERITETMSVTKVRLSYSQGGGAVSTVTLSRV